MSDKEKKEDEQESPDEDEVKEDVNRRSFFTEGFRHMLKPLADVVEARLDKANLPDWEEYERGKDSYHSPSPDEARFSPLPDRPVLRPPGALGEDQFLQTCMGSGHFSPKSVCLPGIFTDKGFREFGCKEMFL